MRWTRHDRAGVAALLAAGSLVVAGPLPAAVAAEVPAADAPTESYVVTVDEGAADAVVEELQALGAEPEVALDDLVDAVAVDLTPEQLAAVDALPLVSDVHEEVVFRADDLQVDPPWNLDRIDQPTLPFDGRYSYPTSAGAGVRVYVVDTGVSAHAELGARLVAGTSTVPGAAGTADCNGHGTHVAGTVAATHYGVAKRVTVVPVRVLDCLGEGDTTTVLGGLDWIAAHHPAGTPGVVNMSLSGDRDAVLDAAVAELVSRGLTVVVAAGNTTSDACNRSPAAAPSAITVGASSLDDTRASFSNYGPCLDLWAPGEFVESIDAFGPGSVYMSGTSMAAPHVAGVAALYLAQAPTATPAQVAAELTRVAVPAVPSDGVSTTRLLSALVGGQRQPGLPPGSPIGRIDLGAGTHAGMWVAGWALDPDSSDPLYLWVDFDGKDGRFIRADKSRPDVGAAYPDYGSNHGFSETLPVAGVHLVCITAVNVGSGQNTRLGCEVLNGGTGSPIGSFDEATGSIGQIRVSGWTIDADPATQRYVWVDVDGVGRAVAVGTARPDVAFAWPQYGTHNGFAATVSVPGGSHRVCVTAINVGRGSNTSLGCRSVTTPGGSPFGNLERVTGAVGAVSVTGWAIDPDTTASGYVWLEVDGVGRHVSASTLRADVGRAFPAYGPAHGFGATVAVRPGVHRVCVTASNVGTGTHTALGCRLVTTT